MDPSATFANCQIQQNTEAPFPHECDNNISQYAVQDLERQTHKRRDHGWRRIVLNFTPSWFSVIMGTGITSILIHNLPYNGRWLYWISVGIFALNTLLFVVFLGISVLRYIMYRGLFMYMIRHPVQSLFIGTFPMGLATIVNMIVFVCVPAWGPWSITLAWTLWWIDVVISVIVCLYLPFVVMYIHESELSSMTAVWLLPIVSTIVASATGGIVAEVLSNPEYALWTLIMSYILWGTGFPLAMVVFVIYFYRLTVYRLPPRETIVSVFLPLGPLGYGSFALMQLGKVAFKIFPQKKIFMSDTGSFFYNMGNYVALILWGYGLVWLFFALASITRAKFPFNMGWWGFTFPLGVYAVATTTLAREMPSGFLKILGTVFSVTVVILWLVISLITVPRVLTGELFFAPCVQGYEEHLAKAKAEGTAKKGAG